MKIKPCCKEITNHDNNIGISGGYDDISDRGKPCYWTGEETSAHDVVINFCPFCGKKLEIEDTD